MTSVSYTHLGLAQAGKKVLLIDGDPQGSLTISLGHPQPDKLPFTLSDAMGRILMDEPLRPGEGILHHPEGVDLMPADIQLSGMEVSLVNAMSRETILRQYLDTVSYTHLDVYKRQELNLVVGSLPIEDQEIKERVKLAAMKLLHEQYGITEKDFIRAELEVVPAQKAREVGFDRALIGAYGHDDRVDAYPALMAEIGVTDPAFTPVCVLPDKEETGSDGNTGLQDVSKRQARS